MRPRIPTLAFALVLMAVAGLALARTSNAQPRVEEKTNIAVTGDITAIDAATRSITVKSTHDEGVDYTVDGSATIMRGASKIALEDLKTGWNVVVNGHDDGTTKRITFIKVVKAP